MNNIIKHGPTESGACIRLLCYIISTKVSQFSVLTAPFPQAGCECPAFEIAVD